MLSTPEATADQRARARRGAERVGAEPTTTRGAAVVKGGMEAAMALADPTPVRVKVGANWGELQDFHSSTEDT